MSTEQKRFEEWWDAKDDIPNNGPWTHDTPIQFAWAGWQAALAQPEQEPVALETVYETIVHWDEGGGKRSRRELARRIVALFTAPPQRTWVGLTEPERLACYDLNPARFASAIEAKLKEKNT